jgi:hypothetical protein
MGALPIDLSFSVLNSPARKHKHTKATKTKSISEPAQEYRDPRITGELMSDLS